jgi:hypothetical protein
MTARISLIPGKARSQTAPTVRHIMILFIEVGFLQASHLILI